MLKHLWLLAVIVSCQAGLAFAQEILVQERVVGFLKSEGQVDFNTVLVERIVAKRPNTYNAHVVVSLWAVDAKTCQRLESSTLEAVDHNAEGNFRFKSVGEATVLPEWLPVAVLPGLPLAFSNNEEPLSRFFQEDESFSDMRDIRIIRVVGAAHLLAPSPTTLIEVEFFEPLSDAYRVKAYKLDLLGSQTPTAVLTGVGCP